MGMAYLPLKVDGDCVGDLLSVGNIYRFYSVRPELSPLDGKAFATVESARRAVAALVKASRSSCEDAGPLDRTQALPPNTSSYLASRLQPRPKP